MPETTSHKQASLGLKLSFGLAGLTILIPCFWLPRIHAGDLSSHIYNAWLACEVQHGNAPGLELRSQWGNSLFDIVLSTLLPTLGAAWTQRLAVSASVLVFFGGLFAWIRHQTRNAWCLLPLLAMLTYGRMFHLGLFNFYLSLGLAFCALVAARSGAWGKSLAVFLLSLSVLAHALGTIIVLALAAFLFLADRLRTRNRVILTISLIGVMCLGRWALPYMIPLDRSLSAGDILGAGHFVLYGAEFRVIGAAALCVVLLAIALRLERHNWRRWVADTWMHILALFAVAASLTPWGLWLPGYRYPLGLLDLRVSFGVVLALLILAARTPNRKVLFASSAVVAAIYFSCLYGRLRFVDAVEDRMDRAVSTLPPRARVVSSLRSASPVDPYVHMVDRVCLARCYSYANYEPASHAFRLRAVHPSPIVQWDPGVTRAMESGQYRIQPIDVPMWELWAPGRADLNIRSRRVEVGERLLVQQVP